MIIFEIDPKPAPRQVHRDRFKPSKQVQAYRDWRDEIRLRYAAECREMRTWKGIQLTFAMPMPPSWSQKRRADRLSHRHEQTPDLDNLVKAVLDAIYYNTGENDARVSFIQASKIWEDKGRIIAQQFFHRE